MRTIDLIDAEVISTILRNNPLLVKKSVLSALKLHFEGKIKQPPKQYIRRNSSVSIIDRIISMPVYVDDANGVAGIKWIGSHPDNYKLGLQRANALIILNDLQTNAPVAILDASQISTQRTFAMTLIGLDTFYPNPKNIACLGMGKLGRLHIEMLPILYPSIEKIFCYSKNAPYADLASEKVFLCNSYQEAIRNAEIIITTTSVTKPYINYLDVSGKKLIINQSVMDFHQDVFENSSHIVLDDWDECYKAKSPFTDAVDANVLDKEKIPTIGEIIFGNFTSSYDGLIFFNPLGMAIEDMILAQSIYYQAKKEKNLPSFLVE